MTKTMTCLKPPDLRVLRRMLLVSVLCLAVLAPPAASDVADLEFSGDWQHVKGKHFIVYFLTAKDRSPAEKILRLAEGYYQRIGDKIGFTRRADYWTWEQRARIVVFPDQETFVQETRQPEWATGFSDRDSHVFRTRTIVTYRQEREFYDGLLPHEISHLILHDFIPDKNRIPIWFDEGVAQLFEKEKSWQAQQIMSKLARRDLFVPFSAMMHWDVRKENDSKKVTIFYAQSLSMVEFLIKKYGSGDFGRLCRQMSEGKTFPEALRTAYTNRLNTIEEFEHKWVRYMKEGL